MPKTSIIKGHNKLCLFGVSLNIRFLIIFFVPFKRECTKNNRTKTWHRSKLFSKKKMKFIKWMILCYWLDVRYFRLKYFLKNCIIYLFKYIRSPAIYSLAEFYFAMIYFSLSLIIYTERPLKLCLIDNLHWFTCNPFNHRYIYLLILIRTFLDYKNNIFWSANNKEIPSSHRLRWRGC